MKDRTVKENLESAGIRIALKYLEANPEENIPALLDWIDRFDRNGIISRQLAVTKAALADENGNWAKLAKSLWTDIDDDVRKKLFENFVVNACVIGLKREETAKKENHCNIPWAILMDPTSACNLRCKGCWAADYGKGMNLSFEEWDSVITQGKKLGTFMYIYSGGEPLVRKDDIIRMCKKHADCVFLAFTNATLIDEEFAAQMLEVKNFIPAISIEGFEKETDFRRGAGTYAKATAAMEILRSRKLPFGVSCCYTSQNAELIGSEAYIDDLIRKGAKFAWFFTYMPVGVDAMPELIATAEQRAFMYRQIRSFRKTKPLFTLDFWNDGEYTGGCIAGGRSYLHINANGDIEPCAFTHYADSNIKEKTLLEAYRSPLFLQYLENQPFNRNMLRPCPLLDNPGRLADMVEAAGAHSTDLQNPEEVHALCRKCVPAAEAWAPVAADLWREKE